MVGGSVVVVVLVVVVGDAVVVVVVVVVVTQTPKELDNRYIVPWVAPFDPDGFNVKLAVGTVGNA